MIKRERKPSFITPEAVERKNKILELLSQGKSYQKVANDFDISRQRVQQIVSPRRLSIGIGICSKCGQERQLHRHHSDYLKEDYKLLCLSCHKEEHHKRFCVDCGIHISYGQRCKVCRYLFYRVNIICFTCEAEFNVQRSYYKYIMSRYPDKKWFCSRHCSGQYLGKNYGFGVSPEHCTSVKINSEA